MKETTGLYVDLAGREIITAYQIRNMQELLQRVSDKLTLKYVSIREDVDQIMSGYIIRTEADEVYEQGIKQGIEKGREEGEERLGRLIAKLLELGRPQDIPKVAKDPTYRKQLYLEMNIPNDPYKLDLG